MFCLQALLLVQCERMRHRDLSDKYKNNLADLATACAHIDQLHYELDQITHEGAAPARGNQQVPQHIECDETVRLRSWD